MCRTRKEIISDEPDVQKLIDLKEKLVEGKVNGFSPDRLYFELTKLEGQIDSTIREFMLMDKQNDVESKVTMLSGNIKSGFENHYEFHRKNPSLVALFKRSPIAMLSFFGAFISASSLFYVKESRDIIFELANLSPIEGQSVVVIGFPLFLFFLVSGIVAFIISGGKRKEKEIVETE